MNLKDINLKDSKTVGFIENFCNENGPTLAMAGGIVLLAVSLWSAFKASKSVTEINEKYEERVQEIESMPVSEPVEEKTMQVLKKEAKTERNVKLILTYKFVILFGAGSAALMFLCNYLAGAKIAGLGIALAASEDKIKKLVNNTKEMIGEEKFKQIEDKTLEQMVMENFIGPNGEPFAYELKNNDFETMKGTLFVETIYGILIPNHTLEEMTKVLKDCENYCERNHGITVTKVFERMGIVLPPEKNKSNLTWGPKCPFKASIGSRTVCGATFRSIEFENSPVLADMAGVPWA